MSTRRVMAKGFTLVEILIVVVILGILAAIVIPQFSSASESAKSSNLVSQVQMIRSQLELYRNQHNGNYPSLVNADPVAGWEQMTETTDVAGATTGSDYGPYLQTEPANPFQTSTGDANKVVIAAGSAGAGNGWTFDATTGEFLASIPTAKATELSLTDDVVETY